MGNSAVREKSRSKESDYSGPSLVAQSYASGSYPSGVYGDERDSPTHRVYNCSSKDQQFVYSY